MIKLTAENTAGAKVRAFQRAKEGLPTKVSPVNVELGQYAALSRVSNNLYACEITEQNDEFSGECSCASKAVCVHLVAVLAVHQGLKAQREKGNHTHTALSALRRNAGEVIPTFTAPRTPSIVAKQISARNGGYYFKGIQI